MGISWHPRASRFQLFQLVIHSQEIPSLSVITQNNKYLFINRMQPVPLARGWAEQKYKQRDPLIVRIAAKANRDHKSHPGKFKQLPGSTTSIQEIIKTTWKFLNASDLFSLPKQDLSQVVIPQKRTLPTLSPSRLSSSHDKQVSGWCPGNKRRLVLMMPWRQQRVQLSQNSTQWAGTERST